jgi:hypothetical protein
MRGTHLLGAPLMCVPERAPVPNPDSGRALRLTILPLWLPVQNTHRRTTRQKPISLFMNVKHTRSSYRHVAWGEERV